MQNTPQFRPLDHLEQFAVWFQRQPPAPPIFDGVSFVGDFAQLVMCRHGQYQAQLGLGKPNAEIFDHTHPNVDTILFYCTGEIYFRVDGRDAWPRGEIIRTADGLSSHAGRTVRVLPGQSHGATFGPAGGAFISFQHWITGLPLSVELDWDGKPLSEEHDRALKARAANLVS